MPPPPSPLSFPFILDLIWQKMLECYLEFLALRVEDLAVILFSLGVEHWREIRKD